LIVKVILAIFMWASAQRAPFGVTALHLRVLQRTTPTPLARLRNGCHAIGEHGVLCQCGISDFAGELQNARGSCCAYGWSAES